MKILTVLGARPQFIKSGSVSRVIAQYDDIDEVIVHTGQHYDANMSDIFFEEMNIPKPKYNLGIGGSSHGAMTGQMLEAIEQVLLEEKPDVVMVYGDTNSTLAGALAAVKLGIPIAHVEAGLRSFNRNMPEEINRIMTDRVSNWLFAPTYDALKHLEKEGVEPEKISMCGDVMYDVALYHSAQLAEQSNSCLDNLGLRKKDYILATVHRAENTDSDFRFNAIFDGLIRLANEHTVVLPMHPRTKAVLQKHCRLEEVESELTVLPPQGYLQMVQLEQHAMLIATDSGGVQKEAYFYRVPCVTLREETEWVETVNSGWNFLVKPNNADNVYLGVKSALGKVGEDIELYGDGNAAQKIVTDIKNYFLVNVNSVPIV